MKSLLIRKSTSNEIVLAEFGRYPLQIRFWQQILKYHQRTFRLNDMRLVSLAMMDGFKFSGGVAGVDKGAEWHEQLNLCLMTHIVNLSVFLKLTLEQLLTEPSSSTLSNLAVMKHHLALLYFTARLPECKSAEFCLLSGVSQIEG